MTAGINISGGRRLNALPGGWSGSRRDAHSSRSTPDFPPRVVTPVPSQVTLQLARPPENRRGEFTGAPLLPRARTNFGIIQTILMCLTCSFKCFFNVPFYFIFLSLFIIDT